MINQEINIMYYNESENRQVFFANEQFVELQTKQRKSVIKNYCYKCAFQL